MTFHLRPYQDETDFWRIRNFLREVFIRNERLEYSWHVARFDYWRWHLVLNCQVCASLEKAISLWETRDSQLAAVLHSLGGGEIRLHVHPLFRSLALEDEIMQQAELQHVVEDCLYLPVFTTDTLRQEALRQRGYRNTQNASHHWRRDLEANIPDVPIAAGYEIRAMDGLEEHASRSWASWRAFHSDEPDELYDGDWSWYQNVQSAPLYRRDLDIVAATASGEIAAFATIFYDDYTRSAVCVLVGTAAEHWRRGLGKAVLTEGMRRLKRLGCRRVFATAYDPAAEALYGSVMQDMLVAETWIKEF